jgi:hypothetical protein
MPATKPAAVTPLSLDALLAQRKLLDDQIKAARQADKHVPVYVVKTLVPRVQRRITAGADTDMALDLELADVRAALVNALDTPATDADASGTD